MKTYLWLPILCIATSSFSQNVGIGLLNPAYRLEVNGTIKSNSNFLTQLGNVGIGTLNPSYRLHVYDGSLAITNTSDNKTWRWSYVSAGDNLGLFEDANQRMTIANGGFFGINKSPSYRLDVGGDIRADNFLISGSDAFLGNDVYVGGDLKVNTDGTDRGIIASYVPNEQGSQLHYYTRNFGASTGGMAAFGQSDEFSIGINGGFSEAPACWVANQTSSGGTTGTLYKVICTIKYCTTTECVAVLNNIDNGSVNYSINWNLVCIGR